MIRWSRKAVIIYLGILTLFAGPAQAGQLVLNNQSSETVTCTVDGWTKASGAAFDWYIQVAPGQSYQVGQNMQRASPVINWASCGNLATRAMNVTPTGPNGFLMLNGQQQRVLNVALYPYIPNPANGNFDALVSYVINTFQQQNPQVLLAAQLNAGTDIYDFSALPQLLGAQGLDVIELDTLYIGFLVSQDLINPATISGTQPLPVAAQASTINGQLWGIPSWLCMDFVYSLDADVQQATSLTALLQFLAKGPGGKPQMAADYNGSWRLPSIYINGYVQTYGYGAIAQAMKMPPDPDATVIDNLVSLTDTCASGGTDNCTNNFYHDSAVPGVTEQDFAHGNASADMGFSEQSFYIKSYGETASLYVAPAAWGQTPQPLLFSDSFVSSKATCADAPCATDATAFTTLMTSLAMKNYIVKAQDLTAGSPWRTLLVAAQSFYQQPEIQNNALYSQYARVFQTAQPFPNNFTSEVQTQMAYAICADLQVQRPQYACKTGASSAEAVPTDIPSLEAVQ